MKGKTCKEIEAMCQRVIIRMELKKKESMSEVRERISGFRIRRIRGRFLYRT